MANKLPSLNVLKVFDVAARHLSFKRAADELCLSPSAVSHQIKVLETQVETQLFERLPRGIALTAAGARYHQQVHKGITILEQAGSYLSTQSSDSNITISCIPFVCNEFLIPALSSFKQAHPDISLKLLSQISRVELEAGKVDMAVRYQKETSSDLEYVSRSPVRLTPICSPSYWQNFKDQNGDFSQHKFISLSVDPSVWPTWLKDFNHHQNVDVFEYELDNFQAVKQATIEGLGLAMGYLPFVQGLLKTGELVAPYESHTVGYGAMYLVYPKKDEGRESIKAVKDWMVSVFDGA